MSIFRAPELLDVNTSVGAIHDEAVPDGAPVSAGVLRELIRNANTQVTREHLVFRWLARAREVAVEDSDPTYGLGSVSPTWAAPIPIPGAFPVPKKYGATRLRARVRANITNDRTIQLFFGSSIQADPARAAAEQVLTMLGVGGLTIYEIADIPCRRGHGDALTLAARALVDPTADDLLDTGTYGGVSSGVIDSAPTLYSIRDTGAAWTATGASRVHLGGHYLVVYDAAGAVRHGPAEIRAIGPSSGGTTDELFFWPPAANQSLLVGHDYEIRQLPQVQISSIAIYTMEANAVV